MGAVAYFSMKAMLLLIDCQYKVKAVLNARNQSIPESEGFLKIDDGTSPSNGGGNHHMRKSSSDYQEVQEVITYSDVAFAAWGSMGRIGNGTHMQPTPLFCLLTLDLLLDFLRIF